MRFVSANYTQYFNKKTKRTGHLLCIVISNTQIVINQDRKIEKKDDTIVLSKSKSLEEHFMNVQSKQDRNSVICLDYLEDGYSQIEIASFLGLSKSAISMLIKNDKSGENSSNR